MRVATISTLSVIVALLLAYLAWIQLADENPNPGLALWKPAEPPWTAEKAARITYNRESACFILSNVSPHAIRHEGERYTSGTIGAYSITERQLPTGEWIDVTPAIKCKGENWGFYPLGPGKQQELCRFRQDNARLDEHFSKTTEKPETLPARVGVRVQTDGREADGSKSSKVVYSEPVILPRVLNAEQ